MQVNPAPRKRDGDGRRRADGGGYGARLKSGLFWFVILAIGVYCYLHQAAICSLLDKAGLAKIQADGGTAPIAAGESVKMAALTGVKAVKRTKDPGLIRQEHP